MSDNKTIDPPVKQRAYWDNADEKLIVKSTQDTAPILESNRFERNEFDVKNNSDMKYNRGFTKVASIPNIVIDKLMRDGTWFDKKAMKRWLNDPDNKSFRTGGGWV
mgnify:FL=1|jgi:hypothetical protein